MYRSILKSKAQTFRSGFTLVELMVVISIIAILAAAILVSLNRVRDRGDNTEMIRQVREYVSALHLAYNANGSEFPWNGSSALQNNHRGCLVDTTGSGDCIYNNQMMPMYPSITPLDQMIDLRPISPPVTDDQGHTFTSVLYASNGRDFWLDYPMKGEFTSNTECSLENATIIAVGGTQFPGVTICRYVSR